MDFVSAAAEAVSRGVVLQVMSETLLIRNSKWRAVLSGKEYTAVINKNYPKKGEMQVDPTNSAHMGVREDDVADFVSQFNRVWIDVLVLRPTAWDDEGRAVSFRETWHRVEKPKRV